MPVEVLARGQAAEVDEGGVDIDERSDAMAFFSSGSPLEIADHERAAYDVFPEGEFAPVLLFAKLPTVIGPKDDDGVVGMGAAFESV